MALGKAIRFVRQALQDAELRKACCRLPSGTELMKILDFNPAELEDAFNMELVKCQTFEEAESVHQLKEWFRMINSPLKKT